MWVVAVCRRQTCHVCPAYPPAVACRPRELLLLLLLLLLADPRSWVARRNSLREGVYIADFQVATRQQQQQQQQQQTNTICRYS
jgi:hypothetical protein